MTNGVKRDLEELDRIKKAIIEAFDKPGQTFAGACAAAKIPYSTAYVLRDKDPQFDKEVIAARNRADQLGGDFAESALMQQIQDKNMTGIIFYLKSKHKDRGYVERVESNVDAKHSGEVKINVHIGS